jgi:hypothetical protein
MDIGNLIKEIPLRFKISISESSPDLLLELQVKMVQANQDS